MESTILKNNYFHHQKQWLCFPYTEILCLFRHLVHENNSEIGNRCMGKPLSAKLWVLTVND